MVSLYRHPAYTGICTLSCPPQELAHSVVWWLSIRTEGRGCSAVARVWLLLWNHFPVTSDLTPANSEWGIKGFFFVIFFMCVCEHVCVHAYACIYKELYPKLWKQIILIFWVNEQIGNLELSSWKKRKQSFFAFNLLSNLTLPVETRTLVCDSHPASFS